MAAFDFKLIYRLKRLNLIDRPFKRPDFIKGGGTEAILLPTLKSKLRAFIIRVLIRARIY